MPRNSAAKKPEPQQDEPVPDIPHEAEKARMDAEARAEAARKQAEAKAPAQDE